MSLFLIGYERRAGRLALFKEFDDSQREQALQERIDQELLHMNNSDLEIVLLGAESRAALQRTHARYFRSLSQLVSDFADAVRETSKVS